MTITETRLTFALSILGWIALAIWTVSGKNSELAALKERVVFVEAECGKLNDKVFWISGQIGPARR